MQVQWFKEFVSVTNPTIRYTCLEDWCMAHDANAGNPDYADYLIIETQVETHE